MYARHASFIAPFYFLKIGIRVLLLTAVVRWFAPRLPYPLELPIALGQLFLGPLTGCRTGEQRGLHVLIGPAGAPQGGAQPSAPQSGAETPHEWGSTMRLHSRRPQ